MYDSADREDWHYIYRWNTGERTDAIQVKFEGKRKVLYTGQRFSAIHWPGEHDTLLCNVGDHTLNGFLYRADPKDDTIILRAPDVEGATVRYEWFNNLELERVLPDTEQYAVVYREMWKLLGWEYGSGVFTCRITVVTDEGEPTVLYSSLIVVFPDEIGGFVQTPQGRQVHDYNIWSMPEWTQIYARLGDTLHFFSELNPDLYPDHAELTDLEFCVYKWVIFPYRSSDGSAELNTDSTMNMYFKDSLYRNAIALQHIYYDSTDGSLSLIGESPYVEHIVYWGIKPNAQIETDSVWVFFPQYPYSNLGGRVDVCLPPGAPLPSAEDTVYTFNLGPWNRELEYVEYAWFDGTKDVAGKDSIVGTDSVFAYLFGKMDSISPDLYAGRVVTRVASDSLWQDTCQCYVSCTDAACSGYDTVRIFLHLLPTLRENVFLPRDSVLCAHLDLDLRLPPAADAYRCFWFDRDSIELPYGHDTTRFTVQGMRGTDGFGAGTDTREPRFFQLRLDHKICGVSFFDTLLVYDQVKPNFTLLCHDTLICRNEPVELDSLNPLVYRPFYTFEWNDGKKGSDYSFTDSGTYVLSFFVNKAFDYCGYDTATDTIKVLWVDPALTDIFIPSDTTFCKDLSITLDVRVPYPSTLYSWQEGPMPDPDEEFEEEQDTIEFTQPVRTIKEEGTYNVLLLDSMGCRNRKEINVTIDECKPSLDIPNVFTPNDDGVNDVLRFKQLEKCTDVV
ncbi:MAG: gliding motility-associated C-terminal domain-containing protein, partial [Bacteroidales bacterium]|nr:gliding motility-associated C-terminal domain-containing protein [Bacteroidales bacterium]